jgi:hypothetical protein
MTAILTNWEAMMRKGMRIVKRFMNGLRFRSCETSLLRFTAMVQAPKVRDTDGRERPSRWSSL